jgi:Nif-specific regulatory protein
MSPAEIKFNHFEIGTLRTLEHAARALDSPVNLKAGLNRMLEILEQYYGVIRSAIVLCRNGSSDLRVEASRGLTPDQQKAFVGMQEGLTDRVIDSGKPVVIHRAGGESLFHQRGAARLISQPNETTFVCVPLVNGREISGVLGVDLRYEKNRDYELTLAFMGLLASMIAQALRMAHLSSLEKQLLPVEIPRTREKVREPFDFSNLIGSSGAMQQVYEQLAMVSRSGATVMIRGESGTGKELIAQAIHSNSLRKAGPFIKVNCAALPDTLIESELFGHEKGAFTGAQMQKKGRFELAEGGTLFLDEIGEVNATTAVKLLRVLQEREFERVGGTRTLKADVRLIVATNKDLEKAIVAGTFREDLFYRINVFSILLPPLRERKPDVLPLADHFLNVFNSAHGKSVKRISTQAIDRLMSHHWPGNVRELSNAIERAVLICDGLVLHACHLPPALQSAEATGTVMNPSLKQATEAHEKNLIGDTLRTTRGNRARAAKLLRTTERVIDYKARKYGIDCSRLK